jgi:FtsP/CotA-like multicopper oxidase with cupredoxin domain
MSCVVASAQAPICPSRPLPGDPIFNPLDLYSQNGVLTVNLTLQNTVDIQGFMHYCYVYMNNGQQIEAPTLRLNPGDTLVMNLTNNIQEPTGLAKVKPMHMHTVPGSPANDCSGNQVLDTSTNMHFHGLNVPPVCHQDEVINTIIESGDPAFQYSIQIPANEPPGLYWYHPHIHGLTTTQVNGGASGALIVEGTNPLVQGLNERIFVLREQAKSGPARDPDANTQMTINFEPAVYPEGGLAAPLTLQAGQREYWRFLNASSKQFAALQLTYNNVVQTLEVISIDGVQLPTPLNMTTLNIPPAGRMEFIIPGLPAGQSGNFSTLGYDTGPVGDINGPQLFAKLSTTGNPQQLQQLHMEQLEKAAHPVKPPTQPIRFANLASLTPNLTRQVYFSEQNVGTNGGTQFYITVQGQTPHPFHMDDPPAIVTNTGSVEDWTITNHTGEVHAFHIHQIHFLVEAINGVPVANPEMQDTVIVPNWTGTGPYPSVTVRMDFRDPNIAGTFVYHCHILDHEDGGMMAKIQVNPAN